MTVRRKATKTVGVSPKTILAGVLPAVATVVAVGIQWLVTGELNRPELITALSGLSAAAFAALGAYLADPGTVQVNERG